MQSLETVSHALSWGEYVFIVPSGDLAPQKEQLLGALVVSSVRVDWVR